MGWDGVGCAGLGPSWGWAGLLLGWLAGWLAGWLFHIKIVCVCTVRKTNLPSLFSIREHSNLRDVKEDGNKCVYFGIRPCDRSKPKPVVGWNVCPTTAFGVLAQMFDY